MKKPFWFTWKLPFFGLIASLFFASIVPNPIIGGVALLISFFILPLIWIIGGWSWNKKFRAQIAQSKNLEQELSTSKINLTNSKLKPCKACGVQISKTAQKCPSCGESNVSYLHAVFGILVFFGLFWFVFQFKGIEKSVANDSLKQYELAKKGGDAIEICVHAGLVVASFNQANDEKNYLEWKRIQKRDCQNAGIPM